MSTPNPGRAAQAVPVFEYDVVNESEGGLKVRRLTSTPQAVAIGEVVVGVVDDVVGADRADHVRVPRAGDTGDLGTQSLGDLHGEGAHASRRPVDEHLVSRLDMSVVAQELQGGGR